MLRQGEHAVTTRFVQCIAGNGAPVNRRGTRGCSFSDNAISSRSAAQVARFQRTCSFHDESVIAIWMVDKIALAPQQWQHQVVMEDRTALPRRQP